eukprot:scaffold422297_cov20-Prasinocladus_malaysianus.AAC.1
MPRRRATGAARPRGCILHTYMTVWLGKIILYPACEHAMSPMGCTGRAREADARHEIVAYRSRHLQPMRRNAVADGRIRKINY